MKFSQEIPSFQTRPMELSPGSLRLDTKESGRDKSDFLGKLEEALKEVDSLQKDADSAVVGFAAGEIKDIHTVALALKKAELSFRFLLAVRRKVVEAYQELSRLNV